MAKPVIATSTAIETITAARAASAADFKVRIKTLANKPSDGSVLRTLAYEIVGQAIAVTERGEETFDAKPVWEKEFVPVFYVGDRKRPGTDENGKLKGEDQYGNALVKLGKMGAFTTWPIDDRQRVALWIAEQKQPGEVFQMSMPNMGTLANQLMEKFDKAPPTDGELKAFAAEKAKKRAKSGTDSELKAASLALQNAIGKIGTATDYDAVTADEPKLGTLALAAHKAVTAYATAAAAYFAAKKKAEAATKPKKGKKGTAMTAAQRNAAANAKFAALLQPASDGSNGKMEGNA